MLWDCRFEPSEARHYFVISSVYGYASVLWIKVDIVI